MILNRINPSNKQQIKNKTNPHKQQLSFSAQKFQSGNYSDWFIKSVNEHQNDSEHKFENWLQEQLNAFKAKRKKERSLLSVTSVKKDVDQREHDYRSLRIDLKNHELDKKAATAEWNKEVALAKVKFEEEKFNIKQNELCPKFCDLVQLEKEGKGAEIPNCIMLEGKDEKLNKELIEWTAKNSNCDFVEIKHTDSLLNCLEKAEENYQNNGDRTLIHVDGFEKLINPKLSPPHNIASCKDIMSAASEDYHSTIIFSAKNPEQLDQIALQPHRVEPIKVHIKMDEPELKLPKKPEVKEQWFDKPEGKYSSEKDYDRQNPLSDEYDYRMPCDPWSGI